MLPSRFIHDVPVKNLVPKKTTNLKCVLNPVYKCTANPDILKYTVIDTLVGREIPEMNLGNIWKDGKFKTWYIPGIYQVYTFMMDILVLGIYIPGLYLIYDNIYVPNKVYVFILLNGSVFNQYV